MDKEKQYAHLVKMVAHARVIAAQAEEDEVSLQAAEVKEIGKKAASKLGFSEAVFNKDTVNEYMQLIQNK